MKPTRQLLANSFRSLLFDSQFEEAFEGRRTARSHAFSLMELLVVICILAILIGLSFPALEKARSSANQTKCASNFRSIGMAIQSYANDNDNTLPGICWMPIPSATGGPGNSGYYNLQQLLAPYLGHTFKNYTGTFASMTLMPEFYCPSLPASIVNSQIAISYSVLTLPLSGIMWYPFGCSSSKPGGNIAPMRIGRLAELAPLSSTPAVQEIDGQGPLPRTSYAWPPNSSWYYLPKPSHGLRNALYFDWHVEAK